MQQSKLIAMVDKNGAKIIVQAGTQSHILQYSTVPTSLKHTIKACTLATIRFKLEKIDQEPNFVMKAHFIKTLQFITENQVVS